MQRFPDCMDLVPVLRRKGAAVEKELARLQEEAKTYPRRDQQLAAIRYYLHFMLWECQKYWLESHKGITNYRTLMDAMERWRVSSGEQICFVTFNYDTMLEDAMLQTIGFEVVDLDGYVQRSDYLLVKLHGSINWGRELNMALNGGSPQDLIRMASTLNISDRFRLVHDYPMIYENRYLVFPALAIPVENKDEFSCPERHISTLEAFLPKVSKILTIGWRATEMDFLAMLRGRLVHKPKVMVVSGTHDGATQTRNNLLPLTDNTEWPTILFDGGFTGLIENLATLDGFLRA